MNQKRTTFLAALLILTAFASVAPARAADINLTGYVLTFEDNFSTLSISNANPKGSANWYAGPANGSTGDFSASTWDISAFSLLGSGTLSDAATYSGGKWYSGLISSVDPSIKGFTQKYGYFEIQCQMPNAGEGAWPSFWMDTTSGIPGGPGGVNEEIDIFEWYGVCDTPGADQDYVSQASHNWNPNGTQNNSLPYLYAPQTPMPDGQYPWMGYHTYGCQIDSIHITWYIDGVQTNQIETPTAYINSPFYLMVDYALGGGWSLSGTPFPTDGSSSLLVNWVRVYSLPSANVPIISSTLTATGTAGALFDYQITASNSPTSFGATGLAPGLGVNTSTGLISGTPTATGTFAATISAVNGSGTGTAALSLVMTAIPAPPLVTSALAATGTDGVAFSYQIMGSNYPTSFNATSLPPGLGVNTSSGLISGTPSATGTFTAAITVANTTGTDTEPLIITLLQTPPAISSILTALATDGAAFSYQITASNNPVSFNATGLPAGLSLDSSTGLISGTPAIGGTFAVNIGATNPGGTGSATLALNVNVNYAAVKGSYDGLVSLNGTNVGLFTLSMTSRGTFTARLTVAGASYPYRAMFTPYGVCNYAVRVKSAIQQIDLSFDSALPGVAGAIAITTSSSSYTYNVESSLRGNFKPGSLPPGREGRYTAIMPAVSGTDRMLPNAPSYGMMSVGARGAIHISGKLGDGTTFSTRAQLHADGTTWTFFRRLYPGNHPGSLAGVITFESFNTSDADGTLDWVKPAQTSGKYYPGGFSTSVGLQAAKYLAPPMASGTAATITLSSGDLRSSIIDSLTISSGNQVAVSGTNDITFSLSPRTGAFNGEFLNPDTNKNTPFSGVFYQKPLPPAGYGLFLGTDQCGTLEITP